MKTHPPADKTVMGARPDGVPRRQVLRQWGYRLNTGTEGWGTLDLAYSGGNSARRGDVELRAQQAVERGAALGVRLTYQMLYRDHLTTTWSRMGAVHVIEGPR